VTRALITGITGQDGSYLAELLLERGVEVFGLVRRTSGPMGGRLDGVLGRVRLIDGDVLDQGSLLRAVEESRPDQVFHLASQSFVGRSWREPVHTFEVTGLGTVRMLEAVRLLAPKARFYQASSSEMFGNSPGPHTVDGPFLPRSPYAIGKVTAHHFARNTRESYGTFVATGILFNHESPRRGPEFVTRKVAIAAARIAAGSAEKLRLGNLAARRDWGWAPDYVRAMVQLLDHDAPIDVIIGTGVSHSVAELCELAFAAVNLDWRDHVVEDPALMRPAEVPALVADRRDAEHVLGWTPTVGFEELVRRMVQAERSKPQARSEA
jgi:GDPmannose 4,6-dehydratase